MNKPEIIKTLLVPNKKRKIMSLGENNDDDVSSSACCSSGNLEMLMGSFYISKDDSSKPQGQDVHFLLPELKAFGLADGVGGCRRRGIDAGEYSRELMSNTVLSIQTHRDNNKNRHQGGAARGGVDLKAVLNDAFLKTGAKGSSTACVVALDGAALHAVNVGDSGFVHVRVGKIIYRSKAQQHRFNRPYQLRKGNGGRDGLGGGDQ